MTNDTDTAPPPDFHPLRLVKDMSIITAGTIVSQGVTFLALPILTRIYSPRDFGVWGIFQVLSTQLPVFVNLRYELAILMAKTDEEAAGAVMVTCVASIALGLLLVPLAAWLGPLLAVSLGDRSAAPYMLLLCPHAAIMGMAPAALYWWMRRQRYRATASYRIIVSLLTVALQVGLAMIFLNAGAFGLIAGSVAAQWAVTLVAGIIVMREEPGMFVRRWPIGNLIGIAREYRRLPMYTLPYTIVQQFYQQIVPIVLGLRFSASVVGDFYLALKLSYNPLATVTSALGQAFLPHLARHTPDVRPLAPAISQILGYLLVLCLPAVIVVTLHADAIFVTIFGPAWSGVVPYIQALVPAYALIALLGWISRIYDVLNRQNLNLVISIGMNVVVLAAFFGAMAITHDPVWSVVGFAIGLFVAHFAWIVLAARIAKFEPWILLRPLRLALAVGGITAAGDMLVSFLFKGPVLAAAICTLLIGYYGFAGSRILRGGRLRRLMQA